MFDKDGNFLGFFHPEEHRTVGPHRAWSHNPSEWCYPDTPCYQCSEKMRTDNPCPACDGRGHISADVHVREHLAWLLYCINEGYLTAQDRAVSKPNWILGPEDDLHPDDIVLKRRLLEMADEVLRAMADTD